jgi:hypothetical protein
MNNLPHEDKKNLHIEIEIDSETGKVVTVIDNSISSDSNGSDSERKEEFYYFESDKKIIEHMEYSKDLFIPSHRNLDS